MGKSSRPKLTPERQEIVVRNIRLGVPISAASARSGISRRTYSTWMKKGREAKSGIYRDFWEAIQDAEVDAEAIMVGKLVKSCKDPKNARWLAWMLERRFGHNWGEKPKVIEQHHSGSVVDGPVSLDLKLQIAGMTPEELTALSGSNLAQYDTPEPPDEAEGEE